MNPEFIAIIVTLFGLGLGIFIHISRVAASVNKRFDHFQKATEDLRKELKGDMAMMREELKGDMATMHEELKGDMATMHEELKGDIDSFRAEYREDRDKILTVIGELHKTDAILLEKISSLEGKFEDMDQTNSKMQDDIINILKDMVKMQHDIRNILQSNVKMQSDISVMQKAISEITQSNGLTQRDIHSITKDISKMESNIDKLSDGYEGFRDIIANFKSQITYIQGVILPKPWEQSSNGSMLSPHDQQQQKLQ